MTLGQLLMITAKPARAVWQKSKLVAALNIGNSMNCIAHACRFYTEEAYSFRVRSVAPNALRILDMQDMHSLRKGSLVCSALLFSNNSKSPDASVALPAVCSTACGAHALINQCLMKSI